MIAFFMLGALHEHSLNHSQLVNPFNFGLYVDSILNTVGMVLLCGMFKDSKLDIRDRIITFIGTGKAQVHDVSILPYYGKVVSPRIARLRYNTPWVMRHSAKSNTYVQKLNVLF